MIATLLLSPAKAQTPTATPDQAIPTPVKPLLAWTIAEDGGAVYVLDATNSLYHLHPTDLSPLAKSAPLFDTKFESSDYNQPHLQADKDYLFVANPLLTQTLVLSRKNFSLVTTLGWAGLMALEPGRRLFMISPDARFYDPDPLNHTLKRPGVFVFETADLNQLPRLQWPARLGANHVAA